MKEEARKFLESGLLDEYLMGTCNDEKIAKVEHFISTYPEVKSEYENLKAHIEKMATKLDSEKPVGLKEAIISCLDEDSKYTLKSKYYKKSAKPNTMIPWAAAIIGFVASIALFNQKQELANVNMVVHAQKNMVERQLEATRDEVHLLQDELALSSHNKTTRILLSGNNLSPDFNSTAFWNDVAEKAIIYVNSPGQLDPGHCYQIWADVDGKMVNLGVLPSEKGSISINHLKNASSINVTIEPKGGSPHPNVEKIVSSQALEKI
ncbi:anti-sigma factor [Portibacter lacus]|uniref:Anti-sigma K factor RskA C-terminal domain-containing protein n=1 Tax=Portibacter lacus TaxID=1099794 RepID=A0AA37SS27_9BACT|nr:anti-sigma factor [Portibacter lacus]GLR17150.1 hypothetical protein GCM10007940_17650 [Portibacter lacus]